MRILWSIIALAFFAILIPIGISFYGEYQVFKRGHLVEVTITEVPACITSKSKGFLEFEFNNKVYDKRLSGNACDDFYVGERIELRYLEGYNNSFLFPDENPIYMGLIAIIMFVGGGIWSLYYAIIKRDMSPPRWMQRK